MGKKKSSSPTNGRARRGSDSARQRLIAAKNRRLKKLIESWLKDESGYDEETWPQLQEALKKNRRSI